MSNFRGISLMRKYSNRVILNRIFDEISPRLRPFPAGFRRDKSCTEQIHITRRTHEQYHQKNILTVMTFIDFKKAFYSINENTMWKILRHYEVPEKIVSNACMMVVLQQSDGIPSHEFWSSARGHTGSFFIHHSSSLCTTEHRSNNRLTDTSRWIIAWSWFCKWHCFNESKQNGGFRTLTMTRPK